MGVLNLTPDSFSDGGKIPTVEDAVVQARRLVSEGAHILDLGGESTRPGSLPVSPEEERRRVLPVVERLAAELNIPLSIDTSKADIAAAAIELGASIINDVTALRGDPGLAEVIARSGAGVVLMHMQGAPATMQRAPHYDDVVAEVLEFLEQRVSWSESRGIPRARIAVDPGIGFGKTLEHNLQLLRSLSRFANLGCTLLVGTSRKGFLGTLTGQDVGQRMVASAVSALAACVSGARVVRVHDVRAMSDALAVWGAQKGWEAEA
ncbi:MAG: dihydropteroate synthase [Isosphaeraceae bacterium]